MAMTVWSDHFVRQIERRTFFPVCPTDRKSRTFYFPVGSSDRSTGILFPGVVVVDADFFLSRCSIFDDRTTYFYCVAWNNQTSQIYRIMYFYS